MAEHYSFFDAVLGADGVTYDREYNAQQFTNYFGSLITTGVMKGEENELEVTTNGSSMITKIDTGVAFIQGRYYANDSFLELAHDTESLGKSRIDRIVIRMDLRTQSRYVKAFVKKGVGSDRPGTPSLTRTPNMYEISLANVRIVGGQTYIDPENIVDERGNDILCPWTGSKILPNFDDKMVGDLVNDVKEVKGDLSTLEKKVDTFDPIPKGMITMWSGAITTIPTGWALCNGQRNTPDLRDRFIVGAGSFYAVGTTGGLNNVTLSASNMPVHSHSAGTMTTSSAGNHRHDIDESLGYLARVTSSGPTSVFKHEASAASSKTNFAGEHTHLIQGNTSNEGGGVAHENRPPFYALAYIMKL